MHAPIIEPQNIETSPTPLMYGMCKYSENTTFPVTQLMNAKQDATNIMGTVANPSKPSVKLTAFEDSTIINN